MNGSASKAIHAGERAGLNGKRLKQIWYRCSPDERRAFSARLRTHTQRMTNAPRLWQKGTLSAGKEAMPYLIEQHIEGFILHTPSFSRRFNGANYLPLGMAAFRELYERTEIEVQDTDTRARVTALCILAADEMRKQSRQERVL